MDWQSGQRPNAVIGNGISLWPSLSSYGKTPFPIRCCANVTQSPAEPHRRLLRGSPGWIKQQERFSPDRPGVRRKTIWVRFSSPAEPAISARTCLVELVKQGYEPLCVDNLHNSNPSVLLAVKEICGKEIPFIKADAGDVARHARLVRRIPDRRGHPLRRPQGRRRIPVAHRSCTTATTMTPR